MTDVSDRTTITTLYQAGEEIYQLMDKVMVIEDGRMIFQGPANEARQYFIDLGFYAPERQTTADFLTSIGDANVRQIRAGMEAQCPKTAAELETAFRNSEQYKKVHADVVEYEEYLQRTGYKDAKDLRISLGEQKSKSVQMKSSYTVSFWRQVLACTKREFWLIQGDKPSLYTKYFIIVSVGLIVESLFYDQPSNTSGAFSRGGTGFFSILFLGWPALTELIKAVSGRVVIARHNDYAFYRPSAVNLARVITDFPMIMAQVVTFGIIMYFMTDLSLEPSKFFIYLLIIYVTTFNLTALYRMFAALSPNLDDAVRFAGISFNLLIIFTGYVIPKPQLISEKIWFGWIYYINPVSYAFEAVLANEFSGRTMQGAPEALVPQGPNVRPGHQGCAFTGAKVDSTTISGDEYLQTNFDYSYSNLWRNFGVLVAFTVLYIIVTMIATEVITFTEEGGGALVYKRSKQAKKQARAATKPEDEESSKPESLSLQNATRIKS
jgi:ATP-binding cassette, subfamily G (WHITE), member 2, SNQ2